MLFNQLLKFSDLALAKISFGIGRFSPLDEASEYLGTCGFSKSSHFVEWVLCKCVVRADDSGQYASLESHALRSIMFVHSGLGSPVVSRQRFV